MGLLYLYTARHDALLTLRPNEISSDHKDLPTCTWKGYHIVLITKYFNFLFISFYILEFESFNHYEGDAYLH